MRTPADPYAEMEFHEIARELGLSVRRVQQLYVQAMKKLRESPEAKALLKETK